MKKANVHHLTLPAIHRRRRPLRVWSSVVLVLGFVFLVSLVHGVYGWSFFRPGNEAVRLEDVRVLTFNHGHQTNARRANPMSQLACVGGAAQGGAMPMTVVCHNVGKASRGDVEWDCVGDLPPHLIFGRTEVNCEGFRYPNDEWILDGSCALTYTLEYASGRAGMQQYPTTGDSMNYEDTYERHQSARPHNPFAFANTMNAHASSWTGSLGVIAFLCVLAVALFGFASTRPARHLPEWAAQFGPGVSPIGGYTEAFPTSPLFGRNNGTGPLGLLSSGALGYFLGRRGRPQDSEWVPEALRNRPVPTMERPVPARAGSARR